MGLTSIQLYLPSASPPVSQLLLAHSVPCAWCLHCYIPVFDPHNVLAFLRFFLAHPSSENFLPLNFWGEERVRMTAGDLDCFWWTSVCHRGLSALQSTAQQEESSPPETELFPSVCVESLVLLSPVRSKIQISVFENAKQDWRPFQSFSAHYVSQGMRRCWADLPFPGAHKSEVMFATQGVCRQIVIISTKYNHLTAGFLLIFIFPHY